MTSTGAVLVAQCLKRFDTMTELSVANNLIDNKGGKALIEAIKGRTDFQNVDLDNNKFTGDMINEIFSVLPCSKLNLIKNVLND